MIWSLSLFVWPVVDPGQWGNSRLIQPVVFQRNQVKVQGLVENSFRDFFNQVVLQVQLLKNNTKKHTLNTFHAVNENVATSIGRKQVKYGQMDGWFTHIDKQSYEEEIHFSINCVFGSEADLTWHPI